MKNIDIEKIYILIDSFGVKFIKPIAIDLGELIFYRDENLQKILKNPKKIDQKKLSYLEDFLNKPRSISGSYYGLIEIPGNLLDYINGISEISEKSLNFPFTEYYKIPNPDKNVCWVRFPKSIEIREWKINKIINNI